MSKTYYCTIKRTADGARQPLTVSGTDMEFIVTKLYEMGASDLDVTKMQLVVSALGEYRFAIRKKGTPTLFILITG